MSTEIVRATDVNVDELARIGKMLAMSGYFDAKGQFDTQVAQMAVKVMAGREMGFGPFASVQGIHIVSGKPSLGANLMAAAVKGHPRYDYRVRQMGDDSVSLEFFEIVDGKRDSLGVSTFSIKDAQAAGVTSNPTWKKFPRNMLFARAMSNGVRWYCPDVFAGNAVYVPEELGADIDEDGNVLEARWEPVSVQPTPHTGDVGPDSMDEVHPMPFDDPEMGHPNSVTKDADPPITDNTRKRLHAVGVKLYGDGWNDKRHALVQTITAGASTSSNDLTEKEARRLIAGMDAKLAQTAATE